MGKCRIVTGILSLVCLAVAANIMVLTKNFFAAPVLALLGTGVLTGLVWIVLSLVAVTRHSKQEGKSLYGLNAVVSSFIFLGICMVIYAFAQHWDRSWDLTLEGRRELATQTVQVLESLPEDVTVLCLFMQIDDELVRIARDKTERFLEQCQKHTDRLKVEFLDPQIELARLKAMGIPYASPQGTIIMQCGSRQKVLTLSGTSPRLEERDFTNGLINIARNAQPKVCFLTGHGERDLMDTNERDGGSGLKALLEGEAYLVERVAMKITAPEIPADCDILVINGMGLKGGAQGDLHPEEIKALQAFLARGGRMLILLDPWLRSAPAENQVEELLPWLETVYGVVVGDDIAISPETKASAELSSDTTQFDLNAPDAMDYRGSFSELHPVTRAFDQTMLLNVVRTVTPAKQAPANVAVTELLRTTPKFWAETDLQLLTKAGKATKEPDETQGPLSVAVAVSVKTDVPVGDGARTRDARLIVIGNSSFASNGSLTVVGGHLNFVMNAMAWLAETEELIAIRPSGKEDRPLILSESQQRAVVWIAVLGTLQAAAAAGVAVYLYRRKYQ